MDKFRTTFSINPCAEKINHQSKLLFLGSCFTDNIGKKLIHYKFDADVNAFGVLYNPVSVANGINILLEKKQFTEADLNFHNHLWYSFYHHSKFSDPQKKLVLDKINSGIIKSAYNFKTADFLFLTFGTAWVFRLKETQKIVSNCHKLPAKLFQREILKTEEIVKFYNELIEKLLVENPDLKIIFTVSPVRHLKDGAEENQVSKATLLLAVNELVKSYNHVSYFPSYEIMMDDLRDYRFYSEDMVHPNQVAIDYIWGKFADVYFDKETTEIISKIEKIILAKNHRALNPKTEKHMEFTKTQAEKIKMLLMEYPFLDLTSELKYFTNID